MKKQILFCVVLTSLSTYAQSDNFEVLRDNANSSTVTITTFYGSDNGLIEIKKGIEAVDGVLQDEYTIHKIVDGVSKEITIPNCQRITTEPQLISDVYNGTALFCGVDTDEYGNEPAFISLNGDEPIIKDLNPGPEGSDLEVITFDHYAGGAFENFKLIQADNGQGRQLYQFVGANDFGYYPDWLQRTFENEEITDVVDLRVDCGFDDKPMIYYQTEVVEQGTGVKRIKLKLIQPNFTQNIPVVLYDYIKDEESHVHWSSYEYNVGGEKIFSEEKVSYVNPTESYSNIILFEEVSNGNNNFVVKSSLHEEGSPLSMDRQHFNLNYDTYTDNYTYVPGNGQLYSKRHDELAYGEIIDFGERRIVGHNKIDNEMYLVLMSNNGLNDLVAPSNPDEILCSAYNLTFLASDNTVSYFSGADEAGELSVIMINHGMVQEIEISGYRPVDSHKNAIIMDGYLVLLGESLDGSVDVLRLAVTPSVKFLSDWVDFYLYPNPVGNQGTLFIESKAKGSFEILSTNGQEVQHGQMFSGMNSIPLNSLNSGVYLFRFEGVTERIVIQ